MTDTKAFNYGKDHLTASIALSISKGEIQGLIDSDTRQNIKRSSEAVQEIVDREKAVYGINTGFGPLCTTMISPEETRLLQENILRSHAVGVGEHIPVEISKLMLVLKVHALAQGYSGIRLKTLDRIIWHIDADVIPLVPSQGSVGASGDLAPLSHLFLPLIQLGKIHHDGKMHDAPSFLKDRNIDALELGPKEGLCLINGTQFIAAFGVKVVETLHNILAHADLIGAMMIEGLMGSVKPFSPELHEIRPFEGNRHVAANIKNYIDKSDITASHANCARVQDPYSLRCMPQVHGASRTAWLHLKQLLEVELNAVTDNPIIFNVDHTISGGNFHGQPLALPLDYVCLAASELGSISDRRTYLSLEGGVPGVPKLLMNDIGLNSGFMIVQYTTAALASENKGLCFPASADSIPTSLGQEDHVSMGSISGRKALQVIQNVEKILAIELLCAAQALDFHKPLKSSTILEDVKDHVRSIVPHLTKDQLMHEYIGALVELIKSKDLLSVVKNTAVENKLTHTTNWSDKFESY